MGSKRLHFALGCYGLALGFVAWTLACPWCGSPGEASMCVSVGAVLRVLFASPIYGSLIGLGTGGLYDRRGLGAAVGFAAPVFFLLALTAVWRWIESGV